MTTKAAILDKLDEKVTEILKGEGSGYYRIEHGSLTINKLEEIFDEGYELISVCAQMADRQYYFKRRA